MKIVLTLCAVLFWGAAGCHIDGDPPALPKGSGGLVEVRLANSGGRTILPEVAELYYTLEFTNGDAVVKATIETDEELTKTVSLTQGTWDLIVKGYLNAAAADTPNYVVMGETTIIAVLGETVSVDIEMKANQTGQGTVSFNITFPTATSATLTWTRIGGGGEPTVVNLLDGATYTVTSGVGTTTSAGEIALPSAYYKALFKAQASAGNIVKREVAHILNGLTATIAWAFTSADLAAQADKTALTGLLITAASVKNGIVVKPNETSASDVDQGTQWVRQTEATAFDSAIAGAQAVANDPEADLEEVLGAEAALTAAQTTYSAAITAGLKPPSKSALTAAIATATSAKSGVAIGVEPSAVPKDVVFVTQSVMTALDGAIAVAQGVHDNGAALQPAIDSAVSALNTAVDTFNGAKQTGSNSDLQAANKAALTTAISNANTAKASVQTAANANEVPTGSYYVTTAEMGALTSAIAAAEVVEQNVSATQQEVDGAVSTLDGAVSTFNSAKKAGTQQAVTFTSLTANGDSASQTTTVLTLTLSAEVSDLGVGDIALSGTANATIGALTHKSGGVYELGVTLGSGGNITVTLTKAGYAFNTPQSVAVHYFTGGGISISIVNPVDQSLSITGGNATISRKEKGTLTLTVTTGYSVKWLVGLVEGKEQSGTSLTLNAVDYTVGKHYAVVIVTIEGKEYAAEASFTVVN
jgi:hypothetical protein